MARRRRRALEAQLADTMARLAQAQACIRDSWRGLKRDEWKQLHAQAINEAREPTAALGEPEE